MPARPTTPYRWASNTNYAGGPDIGTPTKIAPSVGRIADGWRNQDVPPAQEQNWWQGLISDWLDYLEGPQLLTVMQVAAAPVSNGLVVYLHGVGHYGWQPTISPYGAADEYWVITSDDTGFWVHESLASNNQNKIALVGPVPGDTWVPATEAQRINQSVIPYGRCGTIVTPNAYQQTTTNTALNTIITLADFGAVQFDEDDIVTLEASCVIAGDVDFEIGPAISVDGGATWVGVHDISLGDIYPAYAAPAASRNISVAVAFSRSLAADTSGLRLALRGRLLAAGTADAVVSSLCVWVRRP